MHPSTQPQRRRAGPSKAAILLDLTVGGSDTLEDTVIHHPHGFDILVPRGFRYVTRTDDAPLIAVSEGTRIAVLEVRGLATPREGLASALDELDRLSPDLKVGKITTSHLGDVVGLERPFRMTRNGVHIRGVLLAVPAPENVFVVSVATEAARFQETLPLLKKVLLSVRCECCKMSEGVMLPIPPVRPAETSLRRFGAAFALASLASVCVSFVVSSIMIMAIGNRYTGMEIGFPLGFILGWFIFPLVAWRPFRGVHLLALPTVGLAALAGICFLPEHWLTSSAGDGYGIWGGMINYGLCALAGYAGLTWARNMLVRSGTNAKAKFGRLWRVVRSRDEPDGGA